jgi:hypothetical protein
MLHANPNSRGPCMTMSERVSSIAYMQIIDSYFSLMHFLYLVRISSKYVDVRSHSESYYIYDYPERHPTN